MATNNALNNASIAAFKIGSSFSTAPTSASVYATVSDFNNTNPITLNINNTQGVSAVNSKTAIIFSGDSATDGYAKIQAAGAVSDGTSGTLAVSVRSASALALAATFSAVGDLTLTGGITMSGSNTNLTNYSEGTWTPTIKGGSTAGTTSYSTQSGTYRRVGSTVFVYFEVAFSSATGTGDLQLASLPFTCASFGGPSPGAGGYMGAIALPALKTFAAWLVNPSATTAILLAAGNGLAIATTQMVASGDLRGTIIYNV